MPTDSTEHMEADDDDNDDDDALESFNRKAIVSGGAWHGIGG